METDRYVRRVLVLPDVDRGSRIERLRIIRCYKVVRRVDDPHSPRPDRDRIDLGGDVRVVDDFERVRVDLREPSLKVINDPDSVGSGRQSRRAGANVVRAGDDVAELVHSPDVLTGHPPKSGSMRGDVRRAVHAALEYDVIR